jgi:hypothetical protein
MNRVLALFAVAAILTVPFMAEAATLDLTAKITEDQATTGGVLTPTGSNSLGVGSFVYDDMGTGSTADDTLTGNVLILDVLLSGAETSTSIHGPAPAGAEAPAIHGLALGDLKPVSVVIESVGSVSDLLSNLWYVNVKTTAFPDGEIRGQILVVPEPTGVIAAGLGLMALVGYVVRRRNGR